MKVILRKVASGDNYSIESGIADGSRNFDHHGVNQNYPSPCCDNRITKIGENDVVEISHIDADTYIGLLRLAGKTLPPIDLFLAERIDLNGSTASPTKFDRTLLYMVGIGQIAKNLKFPWVSDEPQDISEIIEAMMAKTPEEIVAIGRYATEKSETAYKNCRIATEGKVGYWVIGADDPLDPSRGYEDGIDIVVVHRVHYKSISIYCNPKSEYTFGGKTVGGIEFAGHPKAAGSPRGVAFNAQDGQRVFEEITKSI